MQDAILVMSHDVALAGLIARTLRWRSVYCTILPLSTPLSAISALGPKGVIMAGRKDDAHVLEEMDPALLTAQLPLLMLGNAAPPLCAHYGGECGPLEALTGSTVLTLQDAALFENMDGGERVLHVLTPSPYRTASSPSPWLTNG